MIPGVTFRAGDLVKRIRLASGAQLRLDDLPVVALGHVEYMQIVMQPSPGGKAPWARVFPGEGQPEYLVNLSTVQEVELADE